MSLYLLQVINLPGGYRAVGIGPYNDLGQAINGLIPIIFSLAAIVAFIFLMTGAFKYMSSGGDEKALMSAKSTITASLIGFVIVFVAYWIIKIIEGSLGISIFGSVATPALAASININDRFAPNAGGTGQLNGLNLASFINKFLPALFGIAFIAFFLYFLSGAFSFMSSGGDEKSKAAAKHSLTSAFIGLLFVILSYWIIRVFEFIVSGGSGRLF